MVSFPYYSHTIPISSGILMGVVWEAYHKRVPLLGVPENPIDYGKVMVYLLMSTHMSKQPASNFRGFVERNKLFTLYRTMSKP